MQRAWICLAVFALLAGGQLVPAEDAGSNPVFTNKVRFRIPFRSDPAEMQRLEAREVQLFVSTDRGTRWRMVDKVEPRADHFDFVAPNAILLIITLFSGYELYRRWERRRNPSPEQTAYYRVSPRHRLLVGAVYIGLIVALTGG